MKYLGISLILIALVFLGTTMLAKVLPDNSREAGLEKNFEHERSQMIQAQEEP
ncbi:MAG: hypothetical protein NDI69_01280 [Bacteriovoracaceae bacterium]|nr:hypothetical protein [Bacteriovoracaceae bacterium]